MAFMNGIAAKTGGTHWMSETVKWQKTADLPKCQT